MMNRDVKVQLCILYYYYSMFIILYSDCIVVISVTCFFLEDLPVGFIIQGVKNYQLGLNIWEEAPFLINFIFLFSNQLSSLAVLACNNILILFIYFTERIIVSFYAYFEKEFFTQRITKLNLLQREYLVVLVTFFCYGFKEFIFPFVLSQTYLSILFPYNLIVAIQCLLHRGRNIPSIFTMVSDIFCHCFYLVIL